MALAALRATVTADASMLAAHADRSRPRVDDPAVLQRKWDQARMKLDAGATLRRVIEAADAETLAAVREWAHTWLDTQAQVQQPSGVGARQVDTSAQLTQVYNSLDARLAEVGDADTRIAMEAHREAREAMAVFEQAERHVGRLVSGSGFDAVEAAVSQHYAGQEAGADLPADAESSLSAGRPPRRPALEPHNPEIAQHA